MISVFKSGISTGLNGKISIGGHRDQLSVVGDGLLWRDRNRDRERGGSKH